MNHKTKVFINSIFLSGEINTGKVREYLETHELQRHSFITLEDNGDLKIVTPTQLQQNLTTADPLFHNFVEQKIMSGFVYGFLESFKEQLNIN